MKKWSPYFLWIFSVLCTSILLISAGLYALTDDPGDFIQFCKSYVSIKKYYYRPISDKDLWQHATEGMITSLGDPHTMFITGNKYEQFMQSFQAEYVGIGVAIGYTEEKEVQILSVFPGSPAENAGLKPHDIIREIDEKGTENMALETVSQKIKGPAGTTVSIVVRRGMLDIPYEIERSKVAMPTVSGEMVAADIGYIHIYSFVKHTDKEFEEKLKELKSQGMKKLIIDVRMNPGGIVDTVVSIADKILTKGTILSFHTKDGQDKIFDIKGVEEVMPMAILIDKHSASASEILAGAMQDKKEGVVIGEKSFGKGTVQSIIPNGDQSVLKISIAEYHTAAGRTIDRVGIEPDIALPQTGMIFHKTEDNVLQKAIEVLEK